MDFIIIANAWSAGLDNPTSKHRIALELLRQGHRVLWIEGSGMRTPRVGSAHDRLRMFKKVLAAFRGARREALSPRSRSSPLSTPRHSGRSRDYLSVLSPLFIPLPRYEVVRRLNGLICRWSMRFWGWRLGFRDPVLINYVPVLAEAMRCRLRRQAAKAPRCTPRIVYHCVDRWDAFAMYNSAMMGEMDQRCCRYADVVIASAGELFERCKAVNPNTVLIPHGVDWDHFRQALEIRKPVTIPRNGHDTPVRPAIGFFGLLSEWVDQDLLLRLAGAFPGVRVVLIGKADVPVDRLAGHANIELMGPKPFAELPASIAGFTVGIIPFVVNDLTRSVNPIKLREMLSAGCPVVSTALPEVELYSRQALSCLSQVSVVQIAHSHDEFVAMVRRVMDDPFTPEGRNAISQSMANETWTAKVHEILKLVE